MTLIFDATRFAGITEQGDWSEARRAHIHMLRAMYPELAEWGDLALGSAWGDYSQDIYAVSWVRWLKERDNGFLAYLYISQAKPDFKWGGTGLYMDDVWAYGDARPWESGAPLPAWTTA